MPPPIRLALEPARAIRVERHPDAPIRLERLTQEAPVLRLAGVVSLLTEGAVITPGDGIAQVGTDFNVDIAGLPLAPEN